jgi:hypothetical protein
MVPFMKIRVLRQFRYKFWQNNQKKLDISYCSVSACLFITLGTTLYPFPDYVRKYFNSWSLRFFHFNITRDVSTWCSFINAHSSVALDTLIVVFLVVNIRQIRRPPKCKIYATLNASVVPLLNFYVAYGVELPFSESGQFGRYSYGLHSSGSIPSSAQTGSGTYQASYPNGTAGSFPEGEAAEAWSWPFISIYCPGQE